MEALTLPWSGAFSLVCAVTLSIRWAKFRQKHIHCCVDVQVIEAVLKFRESNAQHLISGGIWIVIYIKGEQH